MMKKAVIEPYLSFSGRCEEAVDFYRETLGAEVEMLLRFKESPEPTPEGMLPEGYEDKVMHCTFRIGGAVVMATDGCGGEEGKEGFHGISLSLSVETADEVDRAIDALAEGGEITMPADKTFWSSRFGMVTDRFGVSWMVGIPAEESES